MLGSFDKSFKKNNIVIPPRAIVSDLEKDIPSNFMIIPDEKKGLRLVPKEGKTIDGSITFTEEVSKRLMDVPKDKWAEYLYRTQQTIDVKSVSVGDKDRKVSIALLGNNPFMDVKIDNVVMIPQPFNAPFYIKCETEEGEILNIGIKQVVYDSWIESKYENINHKAIKIEVFINDEDSNKSRIIYSVSPQKAESVSEAVTILHFFRGIIRGNAKINGMLFSSDVKDISIDEDQVDDYTDFWEKAYALENKLGVHFLPESIFSMDDAKLFSELVVCLLDRKPLTWKKPFKSFHVNGINSKPTMEKLVGKRDICYTFMEDTVSLELLGAKFELYPYCELKGFVIKKIEWDEDDLGGEIIIDETDSSDWIMTRFYLTEKEKKIALKLMENNNHIDIPRDIDVLAKERMI